MSGIRIYPRNSGSGGSHQELENLQGGKAGEYFHTSETQHEKLLALIYENNVSAISVAPAFGERGVNVPLTLTYSISSRDDVFGTADINYGVGSVTADINGGQKNKAAGSFKSTLEFELTLNFQRNGAATVEKKKAMFNAYIPQFAGVAIDENFGTRGEIIDAGLQKFIQASPAISMVIAPADQYIWFVSTKDNALIQDGNNFTQTVGEWNDGVSEFYKRDYLMTLADNTTLVPVFFYRSRLKKTFSNLTYKIS